jgi:hypothetical protein
MAMNLLMTPREVLLVRLMFHVVLVERRSRRTREISGGCALPQVRTSPGGAAGLLHRRSQVEARRARLLEGRAGDGWKSFDELQQPNPRVLAISS